MPCGMMPVAVLLFVRDHGAPLALGGVLSAVYGLAYAFSQPLLGRLTDRHGQTGVFASAGAVASAAMLALPFTGPDTAPLPAAVLVLVAGLSTPPLEPGLRTLWPAVLPGRRAQHRVLAVDNSAQGAVYVLGPPLAAGLHAVAGPHGAFTAAAVLGVAGTCGVLTAAPSRNWRPAPRQEKRAGPVRSPGLLVLYAALAGAGVALGAVQVHAVGAAARHDAPWLAGLLPAALPAGTLLGGFLYTSRTWPGTTRDHLLATAAALTLGWLPLIADPAPAAAVPAVLAPGLVFTPLLTAAFHTVRALAPPGTATEASAWLIAALGLGQAAGTALAGLGPHAAAALPAAGAAAGCALLYLARHRLVPAYGFVSPDEYRRTSPVVRPLRSRARWPEGGS